MPRACEVCGKTVAFGGSIERRGIPKKKGGIGLKIKGRSKRTFKPNIHRIRVRKGGGVVRMHVCAKCVAAGKVERP